MLSAWLQEGTPGRAAGRPRRLPTPNSAFLQTFGFAVLTLSRSHTGSGDEDDEDDDEEEEADDDDDDDALLRAGYAVWRYTTDVPASVSHIVCVTQRNAGITRPKFPIFPARYSTEPRWWPKDQRVRF